MFTTYIPYNKFLELQRLAQLKQPVSNMELEGFEGIAQLQNIRMFINSVSHMWTWKALTGVGVVPELLLRKGLVLCCICPFRDAIAAHSASKGSVVPFVV